MSRTHFPHLLILCVCLVSSSFLYSCKKLPEDLIEAATGRTLYISNTFRFQVVLFRLPGFFCFSSCPTCPTLLSALPCPREYPGWMYKVVDITYSSVAHLRDTETVRSRKPLTIYNSMAFYCLRAGPNPLW